MLLVGVRPGMEAPLLGRVLVTFVPWLRGKLKGGHGLNSFKSSGGGSQQYKFILVLLLEMSFR